MWGPVRVVYTPHWDKTFIDESIHAESTENEL